MMRPLDASDPGPLLNETYKGKYTVNGTQIIFVPDKTKEKRAPKQIIGTIANTIITIPYIVAEGQSKHPLRLDLKREGNF